MQRKVKIFSILSIVALSIGVILATTYIYKERRFFTSNAESVKAATINDTSKHSSIGIIGDSWVADKKLETYIKKTYNNQGKQINVISSGHPGAKSKKILENLLSTDASNVYSSNNILIDKNIKYVIVIAGVNDTAGHIGSDFYAHHMVEIIKTLNEHDKTALILEVPEYGIEEPEAFKSSLKHNLYKLLFDQNKTDVIKEYRNSLNNSLEVSNLDFKIIPFDPVITDYYKQNNLYQDQFHLNEEGKQLLGTYIGEYLLSLKTTE